MRDTGKAEGAQREEEAADAKPPIRFVCPECSASLEVEAASAGMQIRCPSCLKPLVVPRPSVVRIVGLAKADGEQAVVGEEQTLYTAHTAMFRCHPFSFILCLILALVGVGLIVLLIWWLRACGTRLTVTDRRTILERGIFSKFSTEVWHSDVRNLQVRQGVMDRIMNVGYVGISSAGQEGIEIAVDGMPRPREIQALIDRHRADNRKRDD